MNESPVGGRPASLRGRAYPLRSYLVVLVAGTLLPMLLLSVAVIQRLSRESHAASERRLELASRDLGWAVDRELTSTVRTLTALAQSSSLDQGDGRAFYQEAKRALKSQPTWLTTILLTPDGRQVVNTSAPPGKPPRRRATEPASLAQLVKTGRPVIGSLAKGRNHDVWAFPVRVPVMRNGKLKFILTAVITPQTLTEIIQKHAAVQGEWARTVVDGSGVIIARTREPERFIGTQATPNFRKQLAAGNRRMYRTNSLDGHPVYVALSPVGDWGWTSSVSVPASSLDVTGRRALTLIMALGGMLVLTSGAGAYLLARRISRAIRSSAVAAGALTRGEKPHMPLTNVTEVDSLAASLEASFGLLAQRAQERDENLLQVQHAREQAEAALLRAEQASRMKDEFLATVSHELRTPLTAILGWAHLLRAGNVDAEDQQTTLQTIERNARELNGLVDDLLDASRIINGHMNIEHAVVDLRDVVADAVDTVRPSADGKGVHISMRSNGECFVSGEQRRLLQVVLNLLTNAVKFTPAGGEITAELDASGDTAELRVHDSGEGIPVEFLPHIFDRFRQADSSISRRAGGLGLGLAIVRNLVELHGGTVQAESSGPGQGSTFTVRLPLLVDASVNEPRA